MHPQGTGEVSGFSALLFGLQNHALLLLAGLCPADVLSQVCAYVIYNLSLSLDWVRAHVSLPPLANSPHLGSAEAMDSHSLGSPLTAFSHVCTHLLLATSKPVLES